MWHRFAIGRVSVTDFGFDFFASGIIMALFHSSGKVAVSNRTFATDTRVGSKAVR